MKLSVNTFVSLDGAMQGPAAWKRTPAMGSIAAAGWSRSPTRTCADVRPSAPRICRAVGEMLPEGQ